MTPRFPVLIAAVLLLSAVGANLALAQTPAYLWSRQFGGTGADDGASVATDAAGNVFMTGAFAGTVDFGGGPLVSAGIGDIVLARYSPNGTHLWSKRFGGASADYGNAVATDASGNVFLIGTFQGTVDFGGGGLVSAGLDDIVVAKYGPSGTYLWSQRFGSTGSDYGYSVATDASGNIFIAGFFTGTVNFGGGPLVSAGVADMVVAKYSPTGTHIWSQRFGSTGDDEATSVATDASGNIFVTGAFEGTVNFGGGALVSAGDYDIVVAKYGPTGTHLWSQRFGSTAGDAGVSVAADASGNVFMTGYFEKTVDFGGGPLMSADDYDIVVAKYTPTGTHVWSRRFGSTGTDIGISLATDAAGNVFMTGYFTGTADFGGGPLVSEGGIDIVVAKYGPTGTHLWSRRSGGTGNDGGHSVATDASGNVFVQASFRVTADFGGGTLVSAGRATSFSPGTPRFLPRRSSRVSRTSATTRAARSRSASIARVATMRPRPRRLRDMSRCVATTLRRRTPRRGPRSALHSRTAGRRWVLWMHSEMTPMESTSPPSETRH